MQNSYSFFAKTVLLPVVLHIFFPLGIDNSEFHGFVDPKFFLLLFRKTVCNQGGIALELQMIFTPVAFLRTQQGQSFSTDHLNE